MQPTVEQLVSKMATGRANMARTDYWSDENVNNFEGDSIMENDMQSIAS